MTFYDVSAFALNFVTPSILRWLPSVHVFLGLFLAAFSIAFLLRIVLTWYPQVNANKGFWLIVYLPTEPILSMTRKLVSPIGGVDITPVIWVGLTSLLHELLVGQQGIISQILTKSKGLV